MRSWSCNAAWFNATAMLSNVCADLLAALACLWEAMTWKISSCTASASWVLDICNMKHWSVLFGNIDCPWATSAMVKLACPILNPMFLPWQRGKEMQSSLPLGVGTCCDGRVAGHHRGTHSGEVHLCEKLEGHPPPTSVGTGRDRGSEGVKIRAHPGTPDLKMAGFLCVNTYQVHLPVT